MRIGHEAVVLVQMIYTNQEHRLALYGIIVREGKRALQESTYMVPRIVKVWFDSLKKGC